MSLLSLKIGRKFFAFLLIGLVLLLVANKTFYTHSHLLDDGTIVTHAHPYDKGADKAPFKSHQHSSIEFTCFSFFSFLPFIGGIDSLSTFIQSKITLATPLGIDNYHFTYQQSVTGRAPPYFFLS